MIKNILAAIAISAVTLASAHASYVDFQTTALGTYTTLTVDGITFTGSLTVSNDSNGQYALTPSGQHFLDNRQGGTAFGFAFAETDFFGLQIGATNSAQTLSGYDMENNLLGSVVVPNQVQALPYPYSGYYSLNFAGMTHARLSADNGDWILVDYVKTDDMAAPAVPEPETYAMLLAGLGALGLVARRRKSL